MSAVKAEVTPFLRRVATFADYRLGYFEWVQSTLSALSPKERASSLQTAITDTKRAFDTWNQEKLTSEDDIHLMALIRNNLAWYYAEARIEPSLAREHLQYLEGLNEFYRNPTFLLTKAHVLISFANTPQEVHDAIKVYDLVQMHFGHLPDIAQKVAERRVLAESALKQLSEGP